MHEGEPDAATPLDPDEADGLIPTHIHTRAELNVWEQENILEAVEWASASRKPCLREETIRELHRRMFGHTWVWAGRYRTSDKNLGVPWPTISREVRDLVEDGRFWLDHGTYGTDEAVLRLHHRLVWIHPFPNGNGRHARLWCDMLLRQYGRPPFEWKNRQLDREGEARRAYIEALRAADRGDLEPLFRLLLEGRAKE